MSDPGRRAAAARLWFGQEPASIDAAVAVDSSASDAAAIDAPAPDADLGPHLVFVTSTTHDCALGGLTGADAICQARARAANLPGSYMAWLADANASPATRMTHHVGVYQLVTGAAIAQGWNDLTDGNLAGKIDRTEGGVELGGVGCNAPSPTCHFICEGGEVWSNVDGAGNRRNVADCTGWTTLGNATAGNDGKTDVTWTAGIAPPSPRAARCRSSASSSERPGSSWDDLLLSRPPEFRAGSAPKAAFQRTHKRACRCHRLWARGLCTRLDPVRDPAGHRTGT